MENEAMATRQTSKPLTSKTEATVDPKVTNKPLRNSDRQSKRRNLRTRSRAAAARSGRVEATAAVANGAIVHDKPKQRRSGSKPLAERSDLATANVKATSGPPASTKRAKLIGMLERSEGASVAEIGQRLGWLPHTVRAAITGLRKTGREVTRSKDVDDRSVYRLARLEPASQR
jgi:DNA-binding MarR family transcriptional regulator